MTPRGQGVDDQTRHIVAEEFLKARPAVTKPSTAPKPTYTPADAKSKVKAAGTTLDLGMTLWRLRPSAPSEDAARLLVQDATSSELTAERIDTGTTLGNWRPRPTDTRITGRRLSLRDRPGDIQRRKR